MFIHYSHRFTEHLMAIIMSSASGRLFIFTWFFFRGFFLVPPFGTYSISSFSLILWTYFSLSGRLVQLSHSVISDSLQPHGLQHTRPPCPSPTHRVYSNSCPLSWWCHPTISSSVVPFSSGLQSFPASGTFLVSHFFTSGGQSVSFSFSSSPSNEYSGLIAFRMDWLGLLAVQGTLKSLLQHHSSKASILWHLAFFIVQLSHPYTTTGKP